jgi:hypothetical protein
MRSKPQERFSWAMRTTQGLQLLVDAGTSQRRARRGTVTRLSDELTVPGQHGVRLRKRRDLCQRLPTQLLVHLGEGLAPRMGQLDTTGELMAEDAVFRHQIRVAQAAFFLTEDGRGLDCQDAPQACQKM